MDDQPNDFPQRTNQLMQNAQIGSVPGRVAPPMPTTTVNTSPSLTTSSSSTPNITSYVLPRRHRRVTMPMQYGLPSTTGTAYGLPSTTGTTYGLPSTTRSAYGGTYSNYSYRPYMDMGGYSPYNSYGQSMTNNFQNPIVIAAAENSRPAFESIQSVVQSFNAVSMMLESTFTAMHLSFQALLGVAENFTRLRMFMIKLHSTIVSFKLARWFLTKIFYLLRMVRGNRGSDADEDLWTALSTTAQEENSPVGRSWPLVVFTGLLVATPYFVHKLLNSVTPVPLPTNNTTSNTEAEANHIEKIFLCSLYDWQSDNPKTMPLVKGNMYETTDYDLKFCNRQGGWVFAKDNVSGQTGYVPLQMFVKHEATPAKPLPVPIPEEIEPQKLTPPITDVDIPIVLPYSAVGKEKSDNRE